MDASQVTAQGTPFRLVNTAAAAREAVDLLLDEPYLGVDCEGFGCQGNVVCLIQVASRSCTYLFDPLSSEWEGIQNCLDEVMGSPHIIKVLHDMRQDVKAFQRLGMTVNKASLRDTTAGYKVRPKLEDLLEMNGVPFFPVDGIPADKTIRFFVIHSQWHVRPMRALLTDYAVADADNLVRLWHAMHRND